MLTLTRITNVDSPALAELLPIYTDAFPPSERRSEEQLKQLIDQSNNMYFNAVSFDSNRAGLFVYWDMGGFFFLEHLAISADMRNHKIGQQVLGWISENLKGLRLMEVEPAEVGKLASRRISFYERNGYKILNKDYRQPSYSDKNESYPMWIMGNYETTELATYIERIITEAYTIHYGQ